MADQLTATSLTRKAIDAANAGQVDDARKLLAEALTLDRDYERAWLWLGYVARDDAERKFCFERAVEIDEDSSAKAPLAELKKIKAVPPPEVEDIVDPPPPPELTESHGDDLSPVRRWWVIVPLALLALALVGVIAWRLAGGSGLDSPVYIAVISSEVDIEGSTGQQIVRTVEMQAARMNAADGINGHEVVIVPFDDRDDANIGKAVAEEIVADGRFALVIGPRTSAVALAVGPVFAEAGIPVITSTATADSVTEGNPWFFRTIFTNHRQGLVMAAYADHVLGAKKITIVEGDSEYGKTLAEGAREGVADPSVSMTPDQVEDFIVTSDANTVMAMVEEIRANGDPGVILLATRADIATGVIVALRDAGIDAPIIGGDAIGTQQFVDNLLAMERILGEPGRYTENYFASVPVSPDSLPANALGVRDAFVNQYGVEPDWRAYTTWDAALAGSAALGEALDSTDLDDLPAVRDETRKELARINSPERALRGVLGPLYFDDTQSVPGLITIESISNGRYLATAPTQMYQAPASLNVDKDALLESGGAVMVGDQMLIMQQVVYTGINLIEINNMNTTAGTFYADFFIWFLYTGDDSATDIVFNTAAKAGMGLGDPISTKIEDGRTYAVYRVAGDFKGNWDYHDFPFDMQVLPISFNHRLLPTPFVTYVIDSSMLEVTPEQHLQSGMDETKSINKIQNWYPSSVAFYPATLGTSSNLGNPDIPVASRGITFSAFNADVMIERDVEAFLIKKMLPLALLAFVTYLSLYFPTKNMAARVSFGITGILTGAVLMTNVTSQLPSVNYTVAIEWAYYAFIALSALTIMIGMLGDRLYEARELTKLRHLNTFARIGYPLVIIAVIAWYWVQYA